MSHDKKNEIAMIYIYNNEIILKNIDRHSNGIIKCLGKFLFYDRIKNEFSTMYRAFRVSAFELSF